MKINKYTFSIILLLGANSFSLEAQVQVGLFSYSEFFYSPTESHYLEKTFLSGYNETNLSSHWGMSVNYKVNDELSLSIEGQRVNRNFDCNCVNAIISTRNLYSIGESKCDLKLKAQYKVLQIPMSANYIFHSNEKFRHSVGIGNTFVYNLKRENLLYDNLGSLDVTYSRKFLSIFSPELHYDLSARLFKHTYANLSIGIREELSNQVNHAFFAKLGMSYSLEKDKPKQRRRR